MTLPARTRVVQTMMDIRVFVLVFTCNPLSRLRSFFFGLVEVVHGDRRAEIDQESQFPRNTRSFGLSFSSRALSDNAQVLLHRWGDGCRCCCELGAHVNGKSCFGRPSLPVGRTGSHEVRHPVGSGRLRVTGRWPGRRPRSAADSTGHSATTRSSLTIRDSLQRRACLNDSTHRGWDRLGSTSSRSTGVPALLVNEGKRLNMMSCDICLNRL